MPHFVTTKGLHAEYREPRKEILPLELPKSPIPYLELYENTDLLVSIPCLFLTMHAHNMNASDPVRESQVSIHSIDICDAPVTLQS